jgi:hypothetical protein
MSWWIYGCSTDLFWLNTDQSEARKLVVVFKARLLDFGPLFSGDLTQE